MEEMRYGLQTMICYPLVYTKVCSLLNAVEDG